MSFAYTGNNAVGLIAASTLPNDGDLQQAASVNVAFQALLDSIATLATGDPVLSGDPSFTGSPTFSTGLPVFENGFEVSGVRAPTAQGARLPSSAPSASRTEA